MSPARRTWLVVLPIIALSVGAWAVARSLMRTNTAMIPEKREDAWVERHKELVAIARRGDVDLLFLGDSITDFWDKRVPAIWSRYYAPRKAANFGIDGDRTQHVLWRIDHGELEGIKPKVVVLLIGTNNLDDNSDVEIVEAIEAILGRLRDQLPDSKILLLGLFPKGGIRDPRQVSTAPDLRVPWLNAKLARLDDGMAVKFLDLGAAFLDGSGQILQSVEPDYIHFGRKGYQLWADAMEPTLWEMMAER